MLKRPAKLRADAAQLEINMVTDMKQTLLVEKLAALDDVEARLRAVGHTPDHNSKIALDTLDEHITMLLDKRYSQQTIVEEYRASMQEVQSWFETVTRALESLDSGCGMTVDKKIAKMAEIHADCESNADAKLEAVRDKAEAAAREVGDMDRQNVQEQQRSVERRIAELKKRVERRRQGPYLYDVDVKCCSFLHCPPSGRFPGVVKCFRRVPQLLCSFPADLASKGNSQKIVYKTRPDGGVCTPPPPCPNFY